MFFLPWLATHATEEGSSESPVSSKDLSPEQLGPGWYRLEVLVGGLRVLVGALLSLFKLMDGRK